MSKIKSCIIYILSVMLAFETGVCMFLLAIIATKEETKEDKKNKEHVRYH